MNVTELKQECKKLGIKGYSRLTKKQLEEYISKYKDTQNNTEYTYKKTENKLKMVDLFAGTGAFSKAFESTDKVDVIFSNDIEPASKAIYDANFSTRLTIGDINKINVQDIPPHDILTGGFPCQPFSIAGKQEGFNDERSNVFWKIIEFMKYHKPRFVVLENVKNLLSHDNKNTFKTITKSIEEERYIIKYKVINTSDITTIPQHRERVYIICFRDETDALSFNFPTSNSLKTDFKKLLENTVPQKYYYTSKSSIWDILAKSVVKDDTIYQYRRVYVRENKSNECPTLTANMGSGGHNVPIIMDKTGIRKLTPRECFNFQGFPSSYILPSMSDCKLYKLAGNAVSYPVVKLIADRLIYTPES